MFGCFNLIFASNFMILPYFLITCWISVSVHFFVGLIFLERQNNEKFVSLVDEAFVLCIL